MMETKPEGFPRQRLVRLSVKVRDRSRALPIVSDLHVTDIGHFPESPHHYVTRPAGIAHHILIWCASGKGWVEWAGKRKALVRQNGVVLIPKGVPHRYGADEKAPWQIYWVHFSGRRSGDYLKLLQGDPPSNLIWLPDDDFLVEAFESTYRGLAHGVTDNDLLVMSVGLSRMLALIHCHRRAQGLKSRHAEERIGRAMQWMGGRLAEPVALVDLARAAGLSVPHFSVLFKRQAGTSPMRYLERMRMRRACVLLDDTDFPVNEIARQVGYENAFHFSRNFRTHMGLSPRAYRTEVVG